MTRKKSFTPYANEADVLEVGNLMLENRVDRITVSGDVDLTADQAGLAHARRLHEALGAIVAALESRALPEQLPAPDIKQVDNPFA
ncbi:hypothetical protein [Massilia yuzhufengensis]|uniref:Uncharacterized protein n=1 Tax=Massilia yuzhufengensis TaxID=1164594 RepID=A0A1I1R898_9BURK|nr:hypothetical protein [Massilia yuzhufengensis]SFD26540.1 hypothetical protein SAMN05216204_12066 [Massilia yuzhufengensis]